MITSNDYFTIPADNSSIKFRNVFFNLRPIHIIAFPNFTWLEKSNLNNLDQQTRVTSILQILSILEILNYWITSRKDILLLPLSLSFCGESPSSFHTHSLSQLPAVPFQTMIRGVDQVADSHSRRLEDLLLELSFEGTKKETVCSS